MGVGGGGERSKGKGFVTADLGGGGGGGEGGGAGDVPSLEISAANVLKVVQSAWEQGKEGGGGEGGGGGGGELSNGFLVSETEAEVIIDDKRRCGLHYF